MDLTTIEGAISVATSLVDAIVKVAPSIEQGVVSSEPYVQAIAGLIKGTNATQAEIDTLLATANAASAQFETPLAPDDGSTST